MKPAHRVIAAIVSVCIVGASGCLSAATDKADPIVGAWVVKVPGAPFPYQMYVFHADGTALESNPDAGDSTTSDSALVGAWTRHGDRISAKLVEITADRASHAFASRGEISFDIKVHGDAFTGTANASFYDLRGQLAHGPVSVMLEGKRIRP